MKHGQIGNLLLVGYLLLLGAGAVVFQLDASMPRGQKLSAPRAVFASVNAGTLTGFQPSQGTEFYQGPGPWMVLGLTIGGTLFSLVAGGIAVVRILRLPYSVKDIFLAASIVQVAVMVLGAVAPLDAGIFNSMLQAASAFGNSGLYLGGLPGVMSWMTHLVLLPLAVLGGLGLPVLMELFGKRAWSKHTWTVLTMTAGIYLAGFIVLALLQRPDAFNWHEVAASSSVLAINSRSAGFPFEFAGMWPRTVQWAVLVLMVIGASPAGTGGGLKTTTIYELGRGGLAAFRGERASRAFGFALLWLAIYAGVVLVGMGMMLASEPDIQVDRLLFLTVSSVSNVGLAHDPVAIEYGGLYILSMLMLLGRILPVLLLWEMADRVEDAELAVA